MSRGGGAAGGALIIFQQQQMSHRYSSNNNNDKRYPQFLKLTKEQRSHFKYFRYMDFKKLDKSYFSCFEGYYGCKNFKISTDLRLERKGFFDWLFYDLKLKEEKTKFLDSSLTINPERDLEDLLLTNVDKTYEGDNEEDFMVGVHEDDWEKIKECMEKEEECIKKRKEDIFLKENIDKE